MRSVDVLFRLLDGTGRVAEVHLTWTLSPTEHPSSPVAELFASAETFAAQRMRADNEEFVAL